MRKFFYSGTQINFRKKCQFPDTTCLDRNLMKDFLRVNDLYSDFTSTIPCNMLPNRLSSNVLPQINKS